MEKQAIFTRKFTKNLSPNDFSKRSNQIFIILAVLHRRVQRVVEFVSATYRKDNTAAKKHRSGGEPLATLCSI